MELGGAGEPQPEAAPWLAEGSTGLPWSQRWSAGSVSMTGPDDLSGDRAAQARGPCEFVVAKNILQEGQCVTIRRFSDIWLLMRITYK